MRPKRRTFHVLRFGPRTRTVQSYESTSGKLKKRFVFDSRDRYQLIEDGTNWEQAISPNYVDTGELLITQAQDTNLYKALRRVLTQSSDE
tara:strand:- start:458 stop:727 length:270 start_codon:yes stop_codon:yes gene_type:complete